MTYRGNRTLKYPEVNDLSSQSYTTVILRSITYRSNRTLYTIVRYSYPEVNDPSYTTATAILSSMTYRPLQLSLGHRPVMHDDEPEVKPLRQVHQMVCLLSDNTKACLKINTNIFILRLDYVSSQRKCEFS